jgi:hypothetical protein
MKKNNKSTFFKRVLVSVVMLLCLSALNAYAGDGKDIVDQVGRFVEYLEGEKFEKRIGGVMIDRLNKDSNPTRSYTRTLYKGNTYVALATSGKGINDIDLIVYRKSGSNWIQLDKDTDNSDVAVVEFECTATGQYKFEIKGYSYETNITEAFFGFILAF